MVLTAQMTWSIHDPRQQAIPLALAEAERLLDGGAVRVHGGGFAGTIQAWVPQGDLDPAERFCRSGRPPPPSPG